MDAEHNLSRKRIIIYHEKKLLCSVSLYHLQIPFVEEDRMETDASSGMNAMNSHVVLRGPSVELVPFLMQHRVSISTAPVPHLQ